VFSDTRLEWVVDAYALTFGGLMLLGGRAGDLPNRRKMFITGLGLFTVASAAGGAGHLPGVGADHHHLPGRPSPWRIRPGGHMRLTIVAATGGVGRQLLGQALDAGHDVTAVARNPAKLPPDVLTSRAARMVTADLAAPEPQVLESAVAGADAVLSALGPHNNRDAGIAAAGTAAVITAMRAAAVRRIVAISASPVASTPSPGRPNPPRHDPGDGLLMRHVGVRIVRTLFGKIYPDLARMEDLLRDCGLDWTVLRPPRLTGKPLTGSYRTAMGRNVRGGRSIPRADVAHYMLAVVDQPETIGQAIGIAT
jgi:putative NADH-flavin reductase